MPFNLSGWELLIILMIGLLLFGGRLPSVGRNIGKSIVEFKKGLKDVQDDAARDDAQRRVESNPYRAPLTEAGVDRRVSQEPVATQAQQ
jgi:sec-independent protein translocase protein TatA